MLHLAAISPLAFHAPMPAARSRATMSVELPALTPGGSEYAKTMPGLGPFGSMFDPLGCTEGKTVEELGEAARPGAFHRERTIWWDHPPLRHLLLGDLPCADRVGRARGGNAHIA